MHNYCIFLFYSNIFSYDSYLILKLNKWIKEINKGLNNELDNVLHNVFI